MHRTITALAIAAAIGVTVGCGGSGEADVTTTATPTTTTATTATPVGSEAQEKWASARAGLAFYCENTPTDMGEAGVRAVDDVATLIDVAKADPGGAAPEGGTYRAGLAKVAAQLADCNADLAGYAGIGLQTVG